MMLPRWLVIAMLATSILAVLVASGFWWVTWPNRTAARFVELVAQGDIDAANSMMATSQSKYGYLRKENGWLYYGNWYAHPRLVTEMLQNRESETRSLQDVVMGRARYTLGSPGRDQQLLVERNCVVLNN